MSYPVSGMVRDYKPHEYVSGHAIIPHGMAVALNAPGVFRFTGPACPDRHLRAAAALGVDVSGVKSEDAGDVVADCVVGHLQGLGMPHGLAAVGYTSNDIPALVQGTLPQNRVNKLSPREFSENDIGSYRVPANRAARRSPLPALLL